MIDSAWSGLPSEVAGDWTESPEPTLANKLAASLYLAEIGITGADLEYQLTVELAKTRHANKQMYEILSSETNRYRARWLLEREWHQDTLEEVLDLEEQNELLKVENGYNIDALITSQERLDNALAMYDEISPMITWDELLND